ncbi:MFS transporter [Streptoalloteichus hindustanus]|uniref:Predicted arabinose efflux permease, MFS family n=1 Tax=Streptoalloteichus hindustanus TaxID=2017 RepID=A0A1M4WGJ2_STRHI|nr:MFS transporter [Streptoalloteichus hindustanus]SHE80072.1 Predicted arabinose efflux permease, MFS family [Streptoalloteichus hindustanus]
MTRSGPVDRPDGTPRGRPGGDGHPGPPAERRYPWQDDPDYQGSAAPTRPSRVTRPFPVEHAPTEPVRRRPLPPRTALRGPQGTRRVRVGEADETPAPGAPQLPRKLTVTRVAVWRGRQLTQQAVHAFRRAAHADGADRSGLAKLTYTVMANYAVDAAIAVALANTLFFSAATAESRGKVALYLLITVAPFAVVAPLVGPALDRLQRGRRIALAASFAGRVVLAAVMALHFDDWLLYPAALGSMVLSKSFGVLKAAVTPRVLPPEITLVKTNSRLTAFGLAAGGVLGALAAGFAALFGSPGALWFTAALCGVGAWLCLRIPAWVEVTEGEVPASLSRHPHRPRRQPMGRHVVVALWGNGTIRVLTGFLTLFAAFVIKAETEQSPGMQLVLLGVIGAAAGAGNFLGNALGARLHVGRPDQVVLGALSGVLAATAVAALLPGVATAAVLGLVGATGSAMAKVSLDAVIQDDLPEQSRASAFGRSETILQLTWVFGGALGLLLPATWWIGFTVVGAVLAVGLAQTAVSRRGGSLVPGLGGDRPLRPAPVADGPPAEPGSWSTRPFPDAGTRS